MENGSIRKFSHNENTLFSINLNLHFLTFVEEYRTVYTDHGKGTRIVLTSSGIHIFLNVNSAFRSRIISQAEGIIYINYNQI